MSRIPIGVIPLGKKNTVAKHLCPVSSSSVQWVLFTLTSEWGRGLTDMTEKSSTYQVLSLHWYLQWLWNSLIIFISTELITRCSFYVEVAFMLLMRSVDTLIPEWRCSIYTVIQTHAHWDFCFSMHMEQWYIGLCTLSLFVSMICIVCVKCKVLLFLKLNEFKTNGWIDDVCNQMYYEIHRCYSVFGEFTICVFGNMHCTCALKTLLFKSEIH